MKKNIILYSFIALLSGTAGCSDMLDEYLSRCHIPGNLLQQRR